MHRVLVGRQTFKSAHTHGAMQSAGGSPASVVGRRRSSQTPPASASNDHDGTEASQVEVSGAESDGSGADFSEGASASDTSRSTVVESRPVSVEPSLGIDASRP